MSKTTVCIVDDHKIVRQGLKELLEKLGDYEVLEEFESGQLFMESLPLKKPVDIYILDYSMPKMNGIQVLQELEKREEEYKVLLLTQHLDEQIINQAYHYGARGFLHKNCTAHDLKFAIDNIVKIGYNNVAEILKRIRNYDETTKDNDKKEINLSEREFKFLELVCDEKEYTYEQMAEIIGVSVKSIDVYRTSIFERYNIKSKVGLVLFSFKHKLTKPFL
ncbi:response regulator transcription factor [Flavobacterium croceum]|uniref:response regulator transcription factor n=1 Tax=Flavobacterium croceum TaxID=370975 RepID=UPI0024A7C02B|nr:response regulator transcription factor [Flavobacterium croceum]